MINLVDELLRAVLVANVPNLSAQQVRFEAPIKNWYTSVTPANQIALNIFLADLRENRKLRSNDRTRVLQNNSYTEEQAPARLDCHYLITAWSPGTIGMTFEPALDEHLLLHQTATVLMRHALNPSRVYLPGPASPALGWPERFRDHDLPCAVAPVEGFPGLGEFWATMGAEFPWKAALYVVVTVPIELLREAVGRMVTTQITEYHIMGDAGAMTDVWVQIGGHVRNARVTPPVALPGAWVQLESTTGESLQSTRTDAAGRFMFRELQPGRYQVRVRAAGLGELTPVPQVDVPSPAGGYDLEFV